MLRTILLFGGLIGAPCFSSCAFVGGGTGGDYYLRGIRAVASEVGFPDREVFVDPRILRAGSELKIPEPGAIDSLPEGLVAGRAADLRSAGFRTGRIEETSLCAEYLGMSGLRLSPVPDSVQAQVDACLELSNRMHLIASRPESLGKATKMVAVGLGDGQYVVWEVLWNEPAGPPIVRETFRVVSE